MSTVTLEPPTAPANHPLSREEAALYHRQGYLGPHVLCTPEEMAPIRERITSEILPGNGPSPAREQARHMDHRLVYDLCTHPAITGRMAGILGPDLVLWASYFFAKGPGGKEIPWHQDINYWPIDPQVNISAWLAIDHCTAENSCVQLIPGSHRRGVPHLPSRDGMAFGEEADPAHVDASKAIDMVLRPGEFFLFNERTLHHSEPNRSDKRRIGLSMRVTVPFVKLLDQEAPPLFPGHRVMVIRGEDRMGLNLACQPPERELGSGGLVPGAHVPD